MSNPLLQEERDPNKLSDGNGAAAGGAAATPAQKVDNSFAYNDYVESDKVKAADQALQAHRAAKPGAYQAKWQVQIDDILSKIQNRDPFSFDINGEALYQQYKDQYAALGKAASKDVMGQAAAMTGGFGNSYASTAGNQAFQSYLSRLNEVVPEIYGMALDRYNAEGQELYNQYGLLADQENQNYARYQDEYAKWADEEDRLRGIYQDERAFDYGVYADDKNFAYNEHRNAIADQQWQTEYDEKVRQYNEGMAYKKERDGVSDSQWQAEQELRQNADRRAEEAWGLEKDANTRSYSGTDDELGDFNNGALTDAEIKHLQGALGLPATGKYTAKDAEAADGLTAEEAYAKFVGGEKEVGFNAVDSKAVSDFKASVRTRNEFNNRPSADRDKYKTYDAYLEGKIKEWTEERNLTDDEVATLIAYYGL